MRSPDERVVPTLAAIWALAAYVAAIDYAIVQDGTLDGDLRWRWTVGLVTAVASILSIAVVTIPPDRLRRSMLSALCLSLAINLTVMIGLSYIHIAARPLATKSTAKPKPHAEEPKLSESFPLSVDDEQDRPQRAERRPVPTGRPELEPREWVRTPSTAASIPLPEREESLPEPRPRPSTAVVLRQEVVESSPRRFDWQSTLSRQTLAAQPSLGPANAETFLVPRDATDVAPHEAESDVSRQAATSPDRPLIDEAPLSPPTATVDSIARRASVDDTASATPAPESFATLERRIPPADSPTVRPPASSIPIDSPPAKPSDERASPRTPRLARRTTSPAMAPAADAELTSRTPRLEPPQAMRAVESSPSPEIEAPQQASVVRQPASPSPPIAPGRVDRPRTSRSASSASELADQVRPSPVGSSVAARPTAPELPGGQTEPNPVEVGQRPTVQAAPWNRVARRESPDVGQPVSERLAANRSRAIGSPPAVRTDVERPTGAARPATTAMSTAAAAPTANERRVADAAAPAVAARPPAESAAELPPTPPSAVLGESIRAGRRSVSPAQVSDPLQALRRSQPTDLAGSPASRTDTQVPSIAGDMETGQDDPAVTAQSATPLASSRPAARGTSGAVSEAAAAVAEVLEADSPQDERPDGTSASRSTSGLTRRAVVADVSGEGAPHVADPVGSSTARAQRAPLSTPPSVDRSVATTTGGASGQPTTATSLPDTAVARATSSPIVRRSTGAIAVEVEAAEGVGGLARDLPIDVGLTHRQAQAESQHVADNIGRFIRRPLSGPPSINTQVPIPARAYQTRMNRRGAATAGGDGRPSPRTEAAIELGLTYLADQQQSNGSWRLARDGETAEHRRTLTVESDTAASGLALLSFLGAGYHHRSDKYGDVVRSGLEFLITNQQVNGDLYTPADPASNRSAWLYSHAIASIALCEAYGMTQDPALREPAQRAVDFIFQSQHPQRGGWRYEPRVGSDTSVSGWMVMAMRSAELANLAVPAEAWQRVDIWLDMAQASDESAELYRYNPLAPNTVTQGHGRRVTKSMTAVGLLMRMYTGWRRGDREMIAGADFLLNNLPEVGSVRDPQRDTYYWYYATQVMFHMRGEYWQRWNDQLHELLTSSQERVGPLAGSWDPWSPLPDRWAPHAGRIYVTTMNLLSLEVYYRHLPIYEDTAR
jgi:hypothetical protein